MKFVLLFLHVVSLLFTGGSSVYAGNQPAAVAYTLIEKEGQASVVVIDQDIPLMNSGTHSGSEKHYFINDGAEDEQVNNETPQKSRLPLVCNLRNNVLSYPSGVNYYRKSFITPPSFTGQVTQKYIVQRVLRI